MRSTLAAFTLALAACAPPAPPPSTPPPEVIVGSSEIALDRVAVANLDRFAGRYTSGGDTLLIARLGNQLTADLPGAAGPQPLKTVGTGTFADSAGNAYLFSLGVGTARTRLMLIDASGSRREWTS